MAKVASEIKVFGTIGSPANKFDKGDYIDVAQFSADLTKAEASTDDTIEVHIKSDGGRVDSGNAFINAMQASKKEVVAIIHAAYSMGYFMCLGAKKIKVYRNGMAMLHSVQGSVSGSPDEMRAQAEVLDKFNSTIAPLLAARTGLTEEEVTAKYLGKEVYLTAQELLDQKLVDEIIDADATEMPVVTAEMDSTQFISALHNVTADAGEEKFISKISARILQFINGEKKQVVAAVKLSSDEEWRLNCQISSLRDLCNYAEAIVECSSNPQLISTAKEIVTFSSKKIIELVTVLYSEEAEEVITASLNDKVSIITAKVKAKQVDGLKEFLAEDITAQMSDLNTQVTAATSKLQIATASITAKDTEITTLKAKLAGKPVDVPKVKGTGAENGETNNAFAEKVNGYAHNQHADKVLASVGKNTNTKTT